MTISTGIERVRRSARKVLAGEPLGTRTYQLVRRAHAATGGASSVVVDAAARRFAGHRPSPEAPVDAATLDALRRDGIAVLPWRLDDDVVSRLQELARTAPVAPLGIDLETFRTYAARGPLRYHDVRAELPMAIVVAADAMRSPDLQGLVVDPRLLALAGAYLGARPVASPATLTWTTGVEMADWTPHDTRNATLYHWDFDGLAAVRVHVYLTDVGPLDAPMRYMRGSHRISRRRTRLMRAGDVGHSDPAVHGAFDRADEVVITGPAGTVFVSDSQGLHRGSPSRGRERLFAVWPLASSPLVTPLSQSVPLPVPADGPDSDPRFADLMRAGDPAVALFRPAPAAGR